MRRPKPYASACEPGTDVHPVDQFVEARLPHKALRRRILRKLRALSRALGPKRRTLLLDLEALWNQRAAEREEAYFDLAHEIGASLGREEALRAGGPRVSAAYRGLTRAIRHLTILRGAPREAQLRALLEVAWSIVVPKTSKPPAPPRRKKRASR